MDQSLRHQLGNCWRNKVAHAVLHLGMPLQVPHVLDVRLPNRQSSPVKKVGGGMLHIEGGR
jgi:hypothetical protein